MNFTLKYLVLTLLSLVLVECMEPEEKSEEIIETDTAYANISIPEHNLTDIKAGNITSENVTEVKPNGNSTQKYVSCISGFGSEEVQIVNDTDIVNLLLPDTNVTSRDSLAKCVVALFYSEYCPFSSMAAPHFNALPRAFPDIKMVAINAMMYHMFNTQNGIIGVPTIMLFHNGRPVAKYNESEYTLDLFSKFVTKYTNIPAEKMAHVKSSDFNGPVSSVPTKDTDIFLGLSWTFIIVCAVYYFTRSKWWKWIVETVQSNWRESEAQAQHEHND